MASDSVDQTPLLSSSVSFASSVSSVSSVSSASAADTDADATDGADSADSTFRVRPAWKHAVNEAAASISAGLHRRNFRRRLRATAARDASFSAQRSDDWRPCVERLVHRSRWRYFYMAVVLANLLLAVLEPTSVRMAPDKYTPGMTAFVFLEMLMSLFYGFDLWMRWFAGEDVARDWWARGRFFIIVCVFGNGVLSLLVQASNVSRVLRPLLLIERLRNVRKIAASVLTTLPKILQVLFLLSFLVMVGGVAAFTLFAGITGTADTLGAGEAGGSNCEFLNGGITWLEQNLTDYGKSTTNGTLRFACSTFSKIRPDGSPCTNYFDTIWTSTMHLFILITTANYPDIMMPAYDCSRWAALFFVVYILLGLYFLLSLILAVVYTHFSSRNTEMMGIMAQKREQALEHAFVIMSDLTQQHAEEKMERMRGRRMGLVEEAMPGLVAGTFNDNGRARGAAGGGGGGSASGSKKGASDYEMISRADAVDTNQVSLEVWLAVVQLYRPRLPLEVSECLFSMYITSSSEERRLMNFEEFCGAIDHTRLKIRKKNKGKKFRKGKLMLHQSSPVVNGSLQRGVVHTTTGNAINNGSNNNASSETNTKTVSFNCFELACVKCVRRGVRRALTYAPCCKVGIWDGILDLLICVNTLFLFLRLSPGVFSKQSEDVLDWLSNAFLFVFVVEIVLKIFALGFKAFWDMSVFNRVDLITVGGGTISTILFWSKVLARDNRKIADVFLLVRAVRTLRVLRMNMQFRIISATVVQISPALLRYLAVLVALFYAFAVVGMELFAGMLSRDCYPDELAAACEQRIWRIRHSSYGVNHYWSNNFSSLSSALVVLFQQMVVNNWVIVMEGAVAAAGNEWPRLYFISFWVSCVVIVMNVLIAFLIDAYQAHVESITESVQQHDKRLRRRLDSQYSSLSFGGDGGGAESKVRGMSSSSLRRSSSLGIEDAGARRRRRLSLINTNWMNMLRVESKRLGHDFSNLDIRLEKGVGDIYSEVYTR